MSWTDPDARDVLGFDTAQICLSGHITNDTMLAMPEVSEDYCKRCGEKTITSCPKCDEQIRGALLDELGGLSPLRHPPRYCHHCGKAFPWTETAIQAAIELSVEDANLDKTDEATLRDSIADIVTDSPRTQLGATRFKKVMGKLSTEGSRAVRDIIVSIVSESAKKIIWPDK